MTGLRKIQNRTTGQQLNCWVWKEVRTFLVFFLIKTYNEETLKRQNPGVRDFRFTLEAELITDKLLAPVSEAMTFHERVAKAHTFRHLCWCFTMLFSGGRYPGHPQKEGEIWKPLFQKKKWKWFFLAQQLLTEHTTSRQNPRQKKKKSQQRLFSQGS